MGAQEEEEPKDLRDMDGSALSNPSGAQVPTIVSASIHLEELGNLGGTAGTWEMQGVGRNRPWRGPRHLDLVLGQ